MNRRPEPVQPGNPYKLTKRQHVFPAANIARFVGPDGRVELDDGSPTRTLAKPTHSIFCAERAWDQRAERGYMKEIEDNFQDVARRVIEHNALGGVTELAAAENDVVTIFYSLWYFRSRQRELPEEFLYGNGVTGCTNLSPDQFELLESKFTMAIRPDGSLPARHINGANIQMKLAHYANNELAGSKWGVIRVKEGQGELLVPDMPWHGYIPLTPTLSFVINHPSGEMVIRSVALMNRSMRGRAARYIFARSLRHCPIGFI